MNDELPITDLYSWEGRTVGVGCYLASGVRIIVEGRLDLCHPNTDGEYFSVANNRIWLDFCINQVDDICIHDGLYEVRLKSRFDDLDSFTADSDWWKSQ